MVEQDPDNMVETTSCQPASDMSIEGFFMNIVAVNRNVKLIPATLLLQMDGCMSESGKENRELSNDSKLTKKKQRTRSEGPQGRQPLHETTNKIKDFKVSLDCGSVLLSKLRNSTDCNIKIFSPDMEILKFASCRGEKRKGRGEKRKGKSADGNEEIDNKNLKSSTKKITNKENRDDCADSHISESTNRRRSRSTSAGVSREARSTDDGSKVKEVNPRKRTKTDETDTKKAKETRETREKGKNEPKETDNKNLKSSTKKITNKENRDDCADSQISESTNRLRSRSTSAGVSWEARSTDDGSKVKEATTRKRTKTDETDTKKAKETRETREKGKNESEDDILEQILNVSCNTSMTLRPRRQYYWMRKMFEDADESWELPYKSKKTSTTKLAKINNNKETEKKQKEKKEKGVEKVEKKTEKNKSNAGKKTKGETKEGKKRSKSVKAQSGTSSQVKEGIQKPEGKRKSVIAKGKTTKEETKEGKKKSESVKPQSGTSSQVKEVIQKPEDVVITAKRGTLKYLKQRETYVKAVAKEAECEDDFFVAKDFTKKSKLSDLLLMDSSESLTIKTPQGKGQSPTDGVITPRTSLLGHWGVTKETSTVYTPSTRTPKTSKTSAEKTAIIETIFHQLKGRGGGRRRGARKLEENDELAFESMLHNPKTSVVELPELPGLEDGDSSDDDYFNTSDAY